MNLLARLETLARPARIVALSALLAVGCQRQQATESLQLKARDCVAQFKTIDNPDQLADAEQQLYSYGQDAIQPISGALRDRDVRGQLPLIAVLSAIPDPRTPVILIDEIPKHPPECRRQALHGLSQYRLPPFGNPLFPLVKSGTPSDREWTLYAFSRWQLKDAKAAFLAAAKDSDADVRMQAARGLRLFAGPDVVSALEGLIDDKADGVAMEALISLCRIDPANVKVQHHLQSLVQESNQGSVNQREELALLLGECRTLQAEEALSQMLQDPDPRIRAAALAGYARLKKVRDTKPVLRSFETDLDPSVRARAGTTIAKLDIVEALPTLKKMVFGKDRAAARLAASIIKDMHDPLTTGPLIGMIKSPDIDIRRMGAVGEWRLSVGKADYFPIIDQILLDTRSSSVIIRKNAISYLGELAGPQFSGRLLELQKDPSPTVRLEAMEALKRQLGMERGIPDIGDHPKPSWLDSDR